MVFIITDYLLIISSCHYQVFGQKVHDGGIASLSFSPDGLALATSSKDKTVKFWCTTEYTLKGQVSIGGEGLSCDYSPDGTKLAVSLCALNHGRGNCFTVIDTGSYSSVTHRNETSCVNNCCKYSPDGCQLATANDCNSIDLWDPTTGTECNTLYGHRSRIMSIVYTKDGTKLISCSQDRYVLIS